MEIKKSHWIGIITGGLILLSSIFFIGTQFMFLIFGIGTIIIASPFVFSIIQNAAALAEKEEMFLEFARNLVESVKTGTPISKSILNVKNKSYGALSVHVKKLANQISIGIPLNQALETFAKDINNKTISRAITLIGQAERAGGDIGEILEAVANAVNTSDKLKKERQSAISTLTIQGYIIFVVFMLIILVMQFKIVPMISGIADVGAVGAAVGGTGGEIIDPSEISSAFMYLLLIQGLFSGLAIGKLTEGSIKSGVKHSFALMIMSFLVSAGANLFF